MRGNDEFSLTKTTLISNLVLLVVVSPVVCSQLRPGRRNVRVLWHTGQSHTSLKKVTFVQFDALQWPFLI